MARHRLRTGEGDAAVAHEVVLAKVPGGDPAGLRATITSGEDGAPREHEVTVGGAGDASSPAWVRTGAHGVRRVRAVDRGDHVLVWHDGRPWRVDVVERTARRAGNAEAGAAGDDVAAPMPGTVLAVKVAPGDAVAADDVVVVMESMKMEMSLQAHRDGVVAEVLAAEGSMVEVGAVLVRLEPAEAKADHDAG